MLFQHRIPALVVLFLLSWCGLVAAHSLQPRALKCLSHPETLALEIIPRQQPGKRNVLSPRSTTLRHSDSFRLIIAAFGDRFFLHLRPNDDLIHPSARINYYHIEDGLQVISHTEVLLRESVKAYWGVVVPEYASAKRMREDAAGVLRGPHGGPELGWARIMVHHQGDVDGGIPPVFEGAFSVNGVIHHVATKVNYLRNKHHLDPDIVQPLGDTDSALVIWRDSDIMNVHEQARRIGSLDSGLLSPPPQLCGHDSLPYNTDPLLNPALQKSLSVSPWYNLGVLEAISSFSNGTLAKRDDIAGSGLGTNFVDSINNTAGCPTTPKVLYMGVASDCMYTNNYRSQDNATRQILNNWNTASALYKSAFNISLGIVELAIQDEVCPDPADGTTPWNVACASATLSERLSLFSQWRGNKGDDGAGLWHLMSGCPTGSEVGIAWLSTLCQQSVSKSGSSVVSGAAVSTAGRTEWQVIAHEIGHNFGAIHDCTDGCNVTAGCCPLTTSTCDAKSQFVMSPVADMKEMNFSPCSVGNVCSLMQGRSGMKTNNTCLLDTDSSRKTISLQMCGNGIVEAGEDCDPGQGVTSSCCDSNTCKFTSGAICDPKSSPCCTDNCSFAPSSRVCRPSKDPQCDVAERCTGNSSTCPTDTFARNGQSCGSDNLQCASGICTSLAKQCQTVGATMNLQVACPNQNSCLVTCQDPNHSNQCIVLQTPLVDGSPCGYGGICTGGTCQPGTPINAVKAWYTQNLQVSIPVTVVVGLVLLSLLWAIINGIRRCRARPIAARKNLAAPTIQSQPTQGYYHAPWVPPSIPPPRPPSLRPGSSAGYAQPPYRGQMDGVVPPTAISPSVRRNRVSGGNMRELILQPNVTRPPEWVDAALYNGRGR